MKHNLDRSNAWVSSKRTRSSQACSSCRKSKTRCEQPDGISSSGLYRCHRCKVLNMQCSFGNSDPSSSSLPRARPPMDLITVPQIASPQISLLDIDIFAQGSDISDDLTGSMGRLQINTANWNPTPVLTLQELSRHTTTIEDTIDEEFRARLVHVLSREQIRYLLEIFELRFGHWLVLRCRPEHRSSFYDLARCAVASRVLDPATRARVAPQLTKVVEAAVARHIFSSCASTESIKALLILSLWSCASEGAVYDGHLLAAFAVRMGLDLRLSEASAVVIRLQAQSERENGLSDATQMELEGAIRKSRLWISLTAIEAVLHIGTGRESLSRRSAADNSVIVYQPSDTVATCAITDDRDLRIDHAVWILDLCNRGVNIRVSSVSDFDRWHRDILEVLTKYDAIQSLISELPQHTSVGMALHFNASRLLVLYHAIREVRDVFRNKVPEQPWYTQVIHNGINIATALGKEALWSAEGVLRSVVSEPVLAMVRAAPDNVFVLAAFAAVFLTTVYYDNFMATDPHMGLDTLVEKTIERLNAVSHSSDHAASKCAQLISTSLESRRMRFSSRISSSRGDEPLRMKRDVERDPMVGTVPDLSNLSNPPPPFQFPQQPNARPMSGLGNDFDGYINSDVFLDTDFWTSFIHNLSSPSHYGTCYPSQTPLR